MSLHALPVPVRSLLRAKTYVIGLTLTLGTGIALTTALLAIIDTTVLDPPAVDNPSALYEVTMKSPTGRTIGHTVGGYATLEYGLPSTDTIAQGELVASLDGYPAKGLFVSENYFPLLAPGLVRELNLDAKNTLPWIIISDRARSRLFNRDRHLAGRTVRLQGQVFRVAAVSPAWFAGLLKAPPDFWVPMRSIRTILQSPDLRPIRTFVKLSSPSVKESVRQSVAELVVPSRSEIDRDVELLPITSRSSMAGLGFVVGTMLAGFVVLLLVPCINSSNLIVAHAMKKQGDIAIRIALGASGADIRKLFFIEGILLAALSAASGWLLARMIVTIGTELVFHLAPEPAVPMLRNSVPYIRMDWHSVSFAVFMAFTATVPLTLISSLKAIRRLYRRPLAAREAVPARTKKTSFLLAAQIGTATLLLCVTAISVRVIRHASNASLGYDPHKVYSFEATSLVSLASAANALRAESWITSASVASDARNTSVWLAEGTEENALWSIGSESYFRTMGVALISGRGFTAEEVDSGAPLAIVSQRSALYWHSGNPIGETFEIQLRQPASFLDKPPRTRVTIIGVADDVVSGRSSEGIDALRVYLPGRNADGQKLLIRADGNPQVNKARIASRIRDLVGSKTAVLVYTLADTKELEGAFLRVLALASLALGIIALALTVAGLVAALLFFVLQRSKEIGIRVALGSTPRSTLLFVVSWVARASVVGSVIGAAAGVGVFVFTASVDSTVRLALEAGTYLPPIGVVWVSVALSCCIPVARALASEPAVALREE